MLSKPLMQFSVDQWSCVASLLFTWDQTMAEVMKIIVTSFKRSHACTATLSALSPAAGHYQPMPPLETPRHSQASLGQSLLGSLILSPTGDGKSDVLGICELKWSGMGLFNSDEHYIYYCGQESLRRNGVAITGNKRV